MCRRGCVIDKKRGNILKLDRHKYVRIAEHGLTPLSRESRKALYRATFEELQSFSGPNFISMDTPFSLVDGCLYAQLVDMKDSLGPASMPMSYEQLWFDMRKAVDRCHKDGVIKLIVAQEPQKYITYDPNLFPMLEGFRKAGRKVFLLTNSLWDYTNVVMNYLESRKSGADKGLKWMDYFDVIIVGGNKPSFLVDSGSSPLFRVDPTSPGGDLHNIEADIPATPEIPKFLAEGKVFQGGNAPALHKLLGLTSGDRLLYVGDHMYADIVRSKRTLGWRTCLIIHELTAEVSSYKMMTTELREYGQLMRHKALREGLIGLRPEGNQSEEEAFALDALLATELQSLRARIKLLEGRLDRLCHPRWGALFRAGSQQSSLGHQVTDYACLYTSRPSNLGMTSPFRPFRPNPGRLPHDDFLQAIENP